MKQKQYGILIHKRSHKKNDSYLITLKGRISIPFVCQDIFNDDIKAFRYEGYPTFEKVTAWAELPEPYEDEV